MNKIFALGLLALLPGLALAQRQPKANTIPAPAAKAKAAAAPYFQQEVAYSIDVKLDDRAHFLRGHEELSYTNHAPQALAFIWFHLWPNAYRDNTTAFAKQQLRNGNNKFHFAKASQRGFIDSLSFVVNGQAAKLEYDPQNPDMAKLLLPQPLAPEANVRIATPFRVKLPDSFSRMGHVGQSYQVSQWYPKPAVLDRRGWHPMPYLDEGEFFSEYGSFDVTITLPTNYIVGATGQLQNPDEQARLAQLAATGRAEQAALATPDGGLNLSPEKATALHRDLAFPPSAASLKTLRYRQDRVHDFAWFADKRFHVLQDSVALPSGRKVQAMVLFTNHKLEQWWKGLTDVKAALTQYSKWVGEYPYASATAVDGALSAGSGMEYPMVTVTEPGAVIHEVGHNWFYGILGSNERDFAWMDEGVNSYEENRVKALDTLPKPPRRRGSHTVRVSVEEAAAKPGSPPAAAWAQAPYQALASRGLDQPAAGLTSADYTTVNYGVVVYQKTASLLAYLAGYLGQDKFDAAMRLYYERWQFRHPYPEDMQAVFEESTGKKLGWFFQGMLQNTQHYDADLSALAIFPEVVKVLVRTDSPTPWAVPVSSVDKDGRVLQTLWTDPFGDPDPEADDDAEFQLDFKAKREQIAALTVDAGYLTPQLNRRNDRLTVAAHPSRLEPLGLRLAPSVDRWDRAFVNWTPVLGANTSDKFMLGAAFYNGLLAPKRLQYLAMPMYSFSRQELNGIGNLQLNVLPGRFARQVELGVSVQRFERYFKYEPRLTLVLPHGPGLGTQQRITLANTVVTDQDQDRTGVFQAIEYGVQNANALQGWSAQVELNRYSASSSDDASDRFAVLLRASASYTRHYRPKKQVQLRLFGGRFLHQPSNSEFVLGLSGSPDYRRQTAFLDRQQISPTFRGQIHQGDGRDGAFGGYLPVADGTWLSTLNVQADLPVTPLGIFADFGASHDRFTVSTSDTRNAQRLYYDAGLTLPIRLPVLGDVLRFYLPIAGSQYANGLPDSRQDLTDRIRFVLRLDQLNPFRAVEAGLRQ